MLLQRLLPEIIFYGKVLTSAVSCAIFCFSERPCRHFFEFRCVALSCESFVLMAEEVEKMRKELVGSLAASVAMHILLFVCFPGGDYEVCSAPKEERIRREFAVTLSPVPMTAETLSEPLPAASDSQHVPHKMERAELPTKVGEEPISETLLRLGQTPLFSSSDSLRMAAIREEIARPEAVADSSERRRLRIKRNFEEIKRGIMAWQHGKGDRPGPRFFLGGSAFSAHSAVKSGFEPFYESIKRTERMHRICSNWKTPY